MQYAKYLDAEVTAICSEINIQFVKSLGADKTLDYTKADSISKLEVYDFVLDSVGKRKKSQLKEVCKLSTKDKNNFVSIDDEALICSSDRLNKIKQLVEAKKIVPITDRCYPFEQIIAAHRYVEQGHKKGNVAITINT